jgi:UDP-N-acetylglucosamine diphosphorylase/glucosamine-1-phosphate N-acetyltransferase
MNVILFDDPEARINLLPFTFTRPVAGIRTGILTIAEKWERYLNTSVSFSTKDYLQAKFPLTLTSDNLWINGAVCPDALLAAAVKRLGHGEGLIHGQRVIAFHTHEDEIPEVISGKMTPYEGPLVIVDQGWKIFQLNDGQLRSDFALITANRKSAQIDDVHTRVYARENIFLEDGVYLRSAILNAEQGPIYLGKNSVVQEGAIIRGPFSLGESSHVNMGAKMRGNVSVGPFSKIGGEVSASVIFGYSNKAHDGFLGCSVLGEWCNVGADTNTSNLKNNYDSIRVWNYGQQAFVDSGLMFCGLLMGDHSKCGINVMFNTGTVAGVCANIFGSDYPRTFIPSFAWGGAAGFTTFQLTKAFETASRAMDRRACTLTEADKMMLTTVFETEASQRYWETSP